MIGPQAGLRAAWSLEVWRRAGGGVGARAESPAGLWSRWALTHYLYL